MEPRPISTGTSAFPRPLIPWLRGWVLDWPKWWSEKSTLRKFGPLVAILLYWAALVALGGFRTDHLTIGLSVLVLSYGGRPLEPVLSLLFPVLLTAIVYDSMRFYSDYLRGPVHVSEPYLFDKRFFGIHTDKGVLTPNEWWQLHTHAALDLIAGFAYLTFIAEYVLANAYMIFFARRPGGSKRDFRSMWGFFWLNVLGYSTYYWYAAAPPWYVAQYGLGPARMEVGSNAAGCARFDQLLGTHFFTGMYGRAADVFGAIPSLHVAYPLLAVYFAFRYKALRGFSIFFYLLMCFSAVYLNHHYVLDIMWGSTYALAMGFFMDWWYGRKTTANAGANV